MSLATFQFADLAQYTPEKVNSGADSGDFRVYLVGRDDTHNILVHLFEQVTLSVKMNMFGFDDDPLNKLLVDLVKNPGVMVQVDLDKSQSNTPHEKALLEEDRKLLATEFATSFAIGRSDTKQISHTKGGVLDGLVGFEGSTNWSTSGEGVGIVVGSTLQHAGFKAQNNTLAVFTNPYEIARFSARLDYEHAVMLQQEEQEAKKP